MGMLMSVVAKFHLEKIQLCYSVIILILVSIGVLRIVKQSLETRNKNRHSLVDQMVDGQKPIKAISIAQNPTKDGEMLGKLFIKLLEEVKKIMKKLKTFWDKFKGILLSIALGILTVVEMCGGYLNDLCGDKLVIKGVEVIPFITLVSAIVVGIISNGWTKEQKEKIKALFSKSSTNELVQAEIKKTVKADEEKVKEFKKVLATKNTELDNLNTEYETKKNTLSAKREMAVMTPRLATDEDVHLADIAVTEVEEKIRIKKSEIAEVENSIANLNSTIEALKSQL